MTASAAPDAPARLDALIGELEGLPNEVRAPARELAAVIMELHRAGLRRMMTLLAETAGADDVLHRAAADESIRPLLLLHDLHPQDLHARVREALQRLHPHVGAYGLHLEAAEVSSHRLRVRVLGDVKSRRGELTSLSDELRAVLRAAAPEVGEVDIDGLENINAVFVPVASLFQGKAAGGARS